MLFFLSARCGARTEPIGKTTPYGSPIFTCHVRVNNILLFLNEVANQYPRDLEAPWVVRERVLQIDALRACGGRCCTSLINNNIILTRTRNVNIWLLYGVVFPIGSGRCPHRTDRPIGKTARTEPAAPNRARTEPAAPNR